MFLPFSSVADPKLIISDQGPTCHVITDPDPDATCKVITVPYPDPIHIIFEKFSQDFRSLGRNVHSKAQNLTYKVKNGVFFTAF